MQITDASFINQIDSIVCPFCHGDRFTLISTEQTAVYYPPIFEHGRNVNPDGNITTYHFRCLDCGKEFVIKMRYGEIMLEE